MTQPIRSGLLLRTCLEVLRDSPGRAPMVSRDVLAEIERRVEFTAYERDPVKSGGTRWVIDVGFYSGYAATIGWMVKRANQWWITDAGLAALDTYGTAGELVQEATGQYREIFNRRKAARVKYAAKIEPIESLLAQVTEGTWTSYEDLAEPVGMRPDDVADLLAAVAVPNSHRVLHADGRVPEAVHQHFNYRGGDLRARLESEGVEFAPGPPAVASQESRITVDYLILTPQEPVEVDPASRRAWLVRGSNVDGTDLVPQWLAEGWVSVAASQLPAVDTIAGEQRLREIVGTAYRHKSYSVREKLVGEFDAFLRLMSDGDYLVTVHRGEAHLGLIDGDPVFTDSPDRRSNLRRSVRWLNPDRPVDLTELPAPLPTLIQSQDDVVDLTDGLAALDRLYAPLVEQAPPAPAPPEARLHEVSPELASELLLADLAWLQGVRDLLADRRQLVLYGPPGTGKTYLAQKLAAALTEPHAVKLIQFHPSYTYEDFFEGFRPESTDDGTLKFRLTSGPLRKLADDAAEHPSTAYILIIDEINRGNLAKVFGELYFLLEYRDQRIGLQYSQVDFSLPTNLYLIGTMNTADRSIALVDAAMRRRFAFVEMHPAKPPVAGLLRRWLTRHGVESDAADLHDALNARLRDADYAIGPSYFMRQSIYSQPDGLAAVWRHDLLPLLVEHHYADDIDVQARYGLDALRADLP